MNSSYLRFFCRKSFLSIAIACAVIATFPACHAATAPPLDKHARKIEKRLARFRPGTYLDLAFRDSSQTYGSLGALSDASFQFTDADSNRVQTRSYDDVASVKKAKEYIGSGSEPGRHIHLLLPVLIGAGAAAAAFAIVEVVR
jgi:hypothetical protein